MTNYLPRVVDRELDLTFWLMDFSKQEQDFEVLLAIP